MIGSRLLLAILENEPNEGRGHPAIDNVDADTLLADFWSDIEAWRR